jgi:glycosyltransferase involved in cell wall biosynthesis
MTDTVLEPEVMAHIDRVGKSDILVGIPSYNNARTIGHVVRAVQAGFGKYFHDKKCILVNSDGGSTDGTADVVRQTTIDDFSSILVTHRATSPVTIATLYRGVPGKGSAFRTIFKIADLLNVKACAVVDSDLRSITPEWLELLLKPVLEGDYDYVAPLYQRHKYDGTITNNIVYPLTRALYGKRVRQPIGGDFGFSSKLARFYLQRDVWETDVARYGIDVWMTTTAIANGFSVCQSYLGAKIHDPKDPGSDLSAMLFQVVGAAFDLMKTYARQWKGIKQSEPVRTFGFHYAAGPETVRVDVSRLLSMFRLGVEELTDVWNTFLPSSIIETLREVSRTTEDTFHLPDDVWVEIVYRFAVGVHKQVLHREHLLKSLTPLYLGRVASFVLQTRDAGEEEAEAVIEGLCDEFERKKPLLVKDW